MPEFQLKDQQRMVPAKQQRKNENCRQNAHISKSGSVQRIGQQIANKQRQRHNHRIDDERSRMAGALFIHINLAAYSSCGGFYFIPIAGHFAMIVSIAGMALMVGTSRCDVTVRVLADGTNRA